MLKVLRFENILDAAEHMDAKVFGMIKECQIECFESYDDFDLLAFEYYDIYSDGGDGSRIMIYLDRDDLFFFCEDQVSEKLVHGILEKTGQDVQVKNEQILYQFFVKLLKGDRDYLDSLEQKIEDEEEKILSDTGKDVTQRILDIRRKLLRLKRYYEELDTIFDEMAANDNELIAEAVEQKIVILSARTDRYLNAVQNLREMVSQTLEAYQSQLSIRQNDLMKIFTIVTVLFLPLTLIVGWYGMNFANMPELQWKYGYPAAIIVSVLIVAVLIWYFKKKKWM